MNGSDDYTDPQAGWLRFWPISEWNSVSNEFPTDPLASQEPLSGSFVLADHGISAWFFAIDLDPLRSGRIYSLLPHGAIPVAYSFSEFVEMVLQGSDELFRT